MNKFQDNRHYEVTDKLHNIATLVDEPQPNEVEFGEGEKRVQVIPGLGLTNDASLLHESARRLEQGNLLIPVVGSICRGKSTLTSAFLGAQLLPADSEPTTAVITQIVYGTNLDEVRIFHLTGEVKTCSRAEFIETYCLTPEETGPISRGDAFSIPERFREVSLAVMESDSPLCKNGINFVDTLGFNAGAVAERITNDFLAQADIIVHVLGARPLFDEDDVNLLERQPQLDPFSDGFEAEHMFFVINDFGLDDKSKKQIMEETAPMRLKNCYLTAEGEFDQALFKRRVFIVDAKAALEAKIAGAGSDALEQTGLPACMRAIEQLLETEDGGRITLDATMKRRVCPVFDAAKRSIQNQQELLSQSVADVETTWSKLDGQFDEANRKSKAIRGTLEEFIQRIIQKTGRHFDDYFLQSQGTWRERWKELSPRISLWAVMSATFSKRKREALQETLEGPVKHYFNSILEGWQAAIPKYVEEEVAEFEAKVGQEIEDFTFHLDGIEGSFIGDMAYSVTAQRRKTKILQSLMGILTGDINQTIGPFLDSNWSGTFRRLLTHLITPIVVGVVASFFVAGPLAVLAAILTLVAETITMYALDKSLFNDKIRDSIGEELRKKFVELRPEIKDKIQVVLTQRFKPTADAFEGVLRQETDSLKWQLDNALAVKREGEAHVRAEKARLETIDNLLTKFFEEISTTVYGRVLTLEECQQLIDAGGEES